MTYSIGAPDPSDASAYAPGGLVGHDTQVDLERQRAQLKLLQELQSARQQQQQQSVGYQSRPRPGFQLPRGPVIWHPAGSQSQSSSSAGIAGPAPVPRYSSAKQQQDHQAQERHHHHHHHQSQQQQRRAGHVAPSIHTILEIATGHRHGPPSSAPLTTRGTSASFAAVGGTPATDRRGFYHTQSPERTSSSSAGSIVGRGHQECRHGHEPRQQVGQQYENPAAPSASSAVPAAVPSVARADASSSSLAPLGNNNVAGGPVGGRITPAATSALSGPLRRGKWTKAEEEFAAATIKYFCSGLLNLQFGTLLRGFLAQQLHCHPMRISKKLLPGTTFCGVEISRKLGRRAYSPRWCDSPLATQQKLDAEDHLATLRTKFVASIEEEAAATDEVDMGASKLQGERLSETSEELQSRASTATASAAGSPPTQSRGEVKSETTRAGSPAALREQQQMYEYHQQQQRRHAAAGSKRPRQDEEWAAAEQHHTQPRTHQQQQQQSYHHNHNHNQQSFYSPSYNSAATAAATSPSDEPQRRQQQQSRQSWYQSQPPVTMPGTHSLSQSSFYYENVHRAMKLPRLSYSQPQFGEPKPRPSASPPAPGIVLPSLRASLERASSSYRGGD